jgi:aminomethyltransferase
MATSRLMPANSGMTGSRGSFDNDHRRHIYEVSVDSDKQLLKTPLHQWHIEHQGRMVEFAGWSMPVQYTSIIEEHQQTRNSIGMFDVSHMGRLYFSGTNVAEFLDTLTTRRIAGVECGKIRYSLMTNDSGGILDDVLVYHLNDLAGEPFHMMVVNASNRAKIVNWLNERKIGIDIQIEDRTESSAMIAVQGPLANDAVKNLSDVDPDSLAYYTGTTTRICGKEAILSRTGYTGEDGCEIMASGDDAQLIWDEVFTRAAVAGGGAAGLAARDTLRLEAGMPLYGHELSESTNPAQTDLKFAIQMKGREFVGRSAIAEARKNSDLWIRSGLELEGRRAAREECQVFHGEQAVGVVTSGSYTPTLQKSISMAYIHPDHRELGTTLSVDIRGKLHKATVVQVPFYQRPV